MKLADLRKVTIKTNSRIRFPLSNGMECVLNEHGIAQVPAMRAAGDFNLEEELGRAAQFTLEPAGATEKTKARPQVLSREEMAALVGPKSAEAHDEHEE
jgi:hypothetical protein